MAFLKYLSTLLFLLFLFEIHSQINNDVKEAFIKSYHEEQLGLLEKASETILSYYSDKNYEINYRLAWLHYRMKKYSSSIQYYKKATLLKPKSTEAYWAMVQPLLAVENYSALNQCYMNILKIDSKNSTANYRVGLYNYYHKKYSLAKKYFTHVIAVYPSDFDALHMLGWTHYFLGNFETSKAYFIRALIIQPTNESVLSGLRLIK
ncbi:MAG: tetratricopeptide repeat protein [Flavobacteriia bacterium]|nr:tetratricopeptide repeat protein [Flavobacteriia bacterium]